VNHVKRHVALSAAALAVVLVGGCTAAGSSPGPRLGMKAIPPQARGLSVLVVGDSWARSIGVGLAKAGPLQNNTVVNAAQGGCGVMLPTQEVLGQLVATPDQCNKWPQEWPEFVAKHRPDAVVLGSAFWDQAQQVIDGTGQTQDIADPAFQDRYRENLSRAVRLLGSPRVPVLLMNAVFSDNGWGRTAGLLINEQVDKVVRANPGTRLLDIRGQLCGPDSCPRELNGISVYDETGHPTSQARDQLGNWTWAQIADVVGRK
jgi:hypothetical protein